MVGRSFAEARSERPGIAYLRRLFLVTAPETAASALDHCEKANEHTTIVFIPPFQFAERPRFMSTVTLS